MTYLNTGSLSIEQAQEVLREVARKVETEGRVVWSPGSIGRAQCNSAAALLREYAEELEPASRFNATRGGAA